MISMMQIARCDHTIHRTFAPAVTGRVRYRAQGPFIWFPALTLPARKTKLWVRAAAADGAAVGAFCYLRES